MAVIGTLYLLLNAGDDPAQQIGFAVYGVSLALLFLASSTYHFFDLGERNLLLRRGDHAAIFLLIGGTYFPVILHMLDGTWRICMLAGISVVSVLGVVFKLTWFHAPRWIDAAIYLGMGWAVLLPGRRMWDAMTSETLGWLVAGGAFYTVGAIIYATKWPDPWPGKFGFHDVWHVFVLGGAACHFALVAGLIGHPIPPF